MGRAQGTQSHIVLNGFGSLGARRGLGYASPWTADNAAASDHRQRVHEALSNGQLDSGLAELAEAMRGGHEGPHADALRQAIAKAAVSSAQPRRAEWALRAVGQTSLHARRLAARRRTLHVCAGDTDTRPRDPQRDQSGQLVSPVFQAVCGQKLEQLDAAVHRGSWACPKATFSLGGSRVSWNYERCSACETLTEGLHHPELRERPDALALLQHTDESAVLEPATEDVIRHLSAPQPARGWSTTSLVRRAEVRVFDRALWFAAENLVDDPDTWLVRLYGCRGDWDETRVPTEDLQRAKGFAAADWHRLLADALANRPTKPPHASDAAQSAIRAAVTAALRSSPTP